MKTQRSVAQPESRPAAVVAPATVPTPITSVPPSTQQPRLFYPPYGYVYPSGPWAPTAVPGAAYAYGVPYRGAYYPTYPSYPSYPTSTNPNAAPIVMKGAGPSKGSEPVSRAMYPGGPLPAASKTVLHPTGGVSSHTPYYPAYTYPQYPYQAPQPQSHLANQAPVSKPPAAIQPNN